MVLQTPTVSCAVLRRSDRVEISLPIEVIGMEPSRGHDFVRASETFAVSRHGAAIFSDHPLATSQELTIRCLATNGEAEGRVVGLISGRWKSPVYGVAFLDPNANPWGIEFPILNGSDDGLSRVLLGCRSCSGQRVIHLNEIEIHVFEANYCIQQFCRACSTTTLWSRPTGKGLSPAEPPDPIVLDANRRKHGRVRTSVSACVREPGFRDEVVVCENISRGGLSFRTSQPYHKGLRIEIAIPYSAGSGNIFVPAQIVHIQQVGSFFQIGVAFAPVSGPKEEANGYSGSHRS